MRLLLTVPLVAALMLASPAYAEVADKMLIIDPQIDPWIWPSLSCFVALLLELRWRFAGLVTVPFGLLLAFGAHDAFNDPHVGPAILRELGPGYITATWAGVLLAIVFPFMASLALSRRKATQSN